MTGEPCRWHTTHTHLHTHTTYRYTNPTLTTPTLGAATATTINGLTISQTVSGTLTIANNKTTKRKKVTSATKSNGISITMPFWDERFKEMKKKYPEITTDEFHIDILAARFVLTPEWFDVVVASNLFGDILSDLGPACTGTIGIAASANINPEKKFPSLFEPVHGSAPDIAGKGIANPIGQIWSGAMMLDYLGEKEAADNIIKAIEKTLSNEDTRTKDLKGNSNTKQCADAVLANL